MLPPVARKKMQAWIRSRHLICEGQFFVFEALEYLAIEQFEECIICLGGSLISVETMKRAWRGNYRPVMLYHAKASLLRPHYDLKQYWSKYGSCYTKFNE